MKKKLKDLRKGDQVQLYTKLGPVPYPYEVVLIETWQDSDKISGLHLEAPNGNKKMYSSLHKEREMTMWAGYDIGSSFTECPCCGRVIK